YWRAQFVASRIDRPSRTGDDFEGEPIDSTPWQGITFTSLRTDPIACRFGANNSGMLLLGWVHEGAVDIPPGNDHTTVAAARSRLILFDCDRPLQTFSHRSLLTYITLPRALALEAMAGDPVPSGEALRLLPPSR